MMMIASPNGIPLGAKSIGKVIYKIRQFIGILIFSTAGYSFEMHLYF